MAVTKRPKSTSTEGHYITNDVLLPEVLRAKKLGKVTNELAAMFQLIATKYSFYYSFAKYSFREDMVAFAVMNLVANGLKFDETRTNPFSYYTTAIYHSFLQYLAQEKNHRNIRDALLTQTGASGSFAYDDESRAGFNDNHEIYDEHGEVAHHGYDRFRKPTVEEKEVVAEDEIKEEVLLTLRLKAQQDTEQLLKILLKDKKDKDPLVDYE